MADYRKMYFRMFSATEDAIARLIAVQRECEDLFLSEPESVVKLHALSSQDVDVEDPPKDDGEAK